MKPIGLRIASGALRGRRLKVPAGIRPTEQKVREALFSIWTDRLFEATLLDLFAGSGAVGIEAVSRGAAEVTFVESNQSVLTAQDENLRLLPPGRARQIRSPAERALTLLAAEEARFDLVFADPPYAWVPEAAFFASVALLLGEEGELVFEHSSRVELPLGSGGLVRTDSRRYGESSISFYRKGTLT